jgi:hypothetical protein
VGTNEVDIKIIIIILKHIYVFLKCAPIGNRVKNGKIFKGLETYTEVEMVVICTIY